MSKSKRTATSKSRPSNRQPSTPTPAPAPSPPRRPELPDGRCGVDTDAFEPLSDLSAVLHDQVLHELAGVRDLLDGLWDDSNQGELVCSRPHTTDARRAAVKLQASADTLRRVVAHLDGHAAVLRYYARTVHQELTDESLERRAFEAAQWREQRRLAAAAGGAS